MTGIGYKGDTGLSEGISYRTGSQTGQFRILTGYSFLKPLRFISCNKKFRSLIYQVQIKPLTLSSYCRFIP
jgi:hypothetical protein